MGMLQAVWDVPAPVRGTRRPFRAVVRLAATNAVLRDTTIMFALFNVGEGALLVAPLR
jgi:hypothetical protein